MAHGALPFLPAAWAAARDAAPALYDADGWVDYGTLRARIAALTPALAAPRKSLIFCGVTASSAGITAYLAAAASPHAVALLDPALPQWAELVAAYQPEFIIMPSSFQNTADHGMADYRAVDWGGMHLWRRATAVDSAVHPELFLLLLTSGSTGGRKFVRLSYNNISSNTAAIIVSLGLTAPARGLLHLPLSYSFGLSVLHMVLAVGGGVAVTGLGMMERGFWDFARAAGTNLFPGVPYHYEMLERLGLARLALPELKLFLQAGGRLDPELARRLLPELTARGGALYVMYGQTEAAPRLTCFAAQENPEKIGSVGRVLPGGTLTIENEEIIYRGPNVMLGYATDRADLALGDVQGGVLPTGDLGRIDEDGFVTITGRRQRFAKLFGVRIALDEIEALLRPLAPVAVYEAAAQIVIATTLEDAAALRDRAAALTCLPPSWFKVQRVAEFPWLPNGKLDYRRLMESPA